MKDIEPADQLEAADRLQSDHIWAMYFVAKNNHLLASAFVPGCFSGDLLLFRATADLPARNPNLRHGIDTYVGKSKFMIFTAVIN